MHPVKGRAVIGTASRVYNIDNYVVDHPKELEKILDETDGGEGLTVFVRIATPPVEGTLYHLASKFGAPFSYATLNAEKVMAPGQLSYQQMVEVYLRERRDGQEGDSIRHFERHQSSGQVADRHRRAHVEPVGFGAPRQEVGFSAGSTWVCFTDCVVHAATAGQFALEQTFYVDVEAMAALARLREARAGDIPGSNPAQSI